MIGKIILIIILLSLILLVIFRNKFLPQTKINNKIKLSNDENKIFSFTGGGFRAICVHTGILKGLKNRQKTQLSDELKKYSIISGNSGGSWFASLLTYSDTYFNSILNENGPFTYRDYMNNAYKNIKLNYNESKIVKEILKYAPFNETIKKILYLSKHPWQITVKNIVFDPIGDVSNKMISDNTNNLNHTIVWSTNISRMSLLNDNYGYIMNNPDCEGNLDECGISFPATFTWDLTKKSSNDKFYNGNNENGSFITCGNYDKNGNIYNTTVTNVFKQISKPTLPNTLVSDVSSASGAAAGLVSDLMSLQDITTKLHIKYLTSYLVEDLSKNFQFTGIAAKVDNNGIKFTEDGLIPDDMTCKDNFIRLFDGGYSDNTSIAHAIAVWQNKHGINGVCNIININDIPDSKDFEQKQGFKKTSNEISWLFGNVSEKVINYIGNKNIDLFVEKPVIFAEEDFSKGRCLWWGKCLGTNEVQCLDDDNCFAELAVNLYQTTTIENKSFGISAGTKVNLFVLQTDTQKAPIFILPTPTQDDVETIDNYVKTCDAVTTLVNKIEDNVFNAVFNNGPIPDTKYDKKYCSNYPLIECN